MIKRNNKQSLEDGSDLYLLSHEIFHSFDDANGGTAGTTNCETQAYVFSALVDKQTGFYNPSANQTLGGSYIDSNGNYAQTATNVAYGNAMDSLLKDGFTLSSYNTAMTNFKMGSAVNRSGTGGYNNTNCADSITIQPGPNAELLIKQFLGN